MHRNRSKPESDRGWSGRWLRGAVLVLGVVFWSGVGARGVIVTLPEEYPAQKSGEEDAVEKPRQRVLVELTELLGLFWNGRSCLPAPREFDLPPSETPGARASSRRGSGIGREGGQ